MDGVVGARRRVDPPIDGRPAGSAAGFARCPRAPSVARASCPTKGLVAGAPGGANPIHEPAIIPTLREPGDDRRTSKVRITTTRYLISNRRREDTRRGPHRGRRVVR